MREANLLFSKIVATPRDNSWSQAYGAGKIFAVLSLEKEVLDLAIDEGGEEKSLNLLGKELLESLEQEFFSLGEKDFSSIKTVVQMTAQKVPQDIKLSFVIGVFIKNILYAFILGSGRVDIKRGVKLGTILEENTGTSIKGASGFLEDTDIVILQTKQFAQIIEQNILSSSLDTNSPNEIAEALAPIIHGQENGGAAAIIIRYNLENDIPASSLVKEEDKEINQTSEETVLGNASSRHGKNYLLSALKKTGLSKINFNHSKKILLTLSVIVSVVLIASIFLAVRKSDEAKTKALFGSIYPLAFKKYKDGQSLIDLNKNLARDSFTASLKILEDGKSKFPKNSKEEKQITNLLEKVNKELEVSSPERIAQNLDKGNISITVENGSGLEGTAAKASDFLKGKGYKIISTGNADNYNYKGTTIKVKNSTTPYLNLLKKDLSEKYTVGKTSTDLPQDFTADVLVIIGK